MSENERAARKLIETAMATAHYPLAEPDFIDIPLTDIECGRIAINYPYSFQEIRAAFPVQGDNRDEKQ